MKLTKADKPKPKRATGFVVNSRGEWAWSFSTAGAYVGAQQMALIPVSRKLWGLRPIQQ